MRLDAPLRTKLDSFKFLGPGLDLMDYSYAFAIANGEITGKTPLRITGVSRLLNGAWYTLISEEWTPYVWQTADQQIRVVSSDNDDKTGDTGALTIRIWWLNSANTESTLDVNMNGTTFVDTAVVTCRRINRMEVLTAGTSEKNEGIIRAYATDGATEIAHIARQSNGTASLYLGSSDGIIQTVPAGYRDVITSWNISCYGEDWARFYARTSPTSPWILLDKAGFQGEQGAVKHRFSVPIVLTAGTDYFVEAYSNTADELNYQTLLGWRETV